MKKYIVLGLILLAPLSAAAKTVTYQGGTAECTSGVFTDAQGATSTLSQVQFNQACSSGGGIPSQISMPWGLTGGETPTVKSGDVVKDEFGVTEQCPWWFGQLGCYDLTSTNYYRVRMAEDVLHMHALGYTAKDFPRLAGWFAQIH